MTYAAQIRNFPVLIAFCFLVSHACCSQNQVGKTALADSKSSQKAITGAEQFFEYLPMLKNKRVALVANHTSLVDGRHLVDTLRSQGVNIVSVFAPEHGFRGAADAGEKIASGKDPKTGLPVVSLYGENKKPTAAQLKDIGIVVFDIQDVGARFYTYISTLSYVMEACAEQNIPVLVLDRPMKSTSTTQAVACGAVQRRTASSPAAPGCIARLSAGMRVPLRLRSTSVWFR
jgi:uncharacterized protein YbbC (DUF1343 family)